MRIRWRGLLGTLAGACVGTVALVGVLLAWNAPPAVPALSTAGPAQPYVVKFHARWCSTCMATKDEWAAVQNAYTGRVKFVVFDFTTDATTEAGRAQARQLGLDAVFEENVGSPGAVLVLDGASKEVKHSLGGVLDESEYRAAIDATLAQAGRAGPS
jgi:thiol-disulfide isomerase/thioredoxin